MKVASLKCVQGLVEVDTPNFDILPLTKSRQAFDMRYKLDVASFTVTVYFHDVPEMRKIRKNSHQIHSSTDYLSCSSF